MRAASEAEKARLAETFVALCKIPSSTDEEEEEAAAWVKDALRAMAIAVATDAAGNLLARIPGRSQRTILFCAHLDTVEVAGGVIEPVLRDGFWTNAGAAILGADDKVGVALLVELARRVCVEGSPVGIELLFTTGEERGMIGAKAFDFSTLKAEIGYIFDLGAPIGGLVNTAPTRYLVAAEFFGQAAHAGEPEEGRSAIVAAARAIAALPVGRVDAQTTANVGAIIGGEEESVNVVAERCRVRADARSLDATRVEQLVSEMVDVLNDAAGESECDVDIEVEKIYDGYRLGGAVLAPAREALSACGFEPEIVASGGGADAAIITARGIPCVNIANGSTHGHSPNESVSADSLDALLDLTFTLLERS